MTELVYDDLRDKGTLRVSWFGRLEKSPSPGHRQTVSIRTYFLPVESHVSSTKDIRPWITLNRPVQELVLLHLNAIVKNGKIIRSSKPNWPFEKSISINVDLSRSNLTVFQRYEENDEGELIIPDRSGRLRGDPEGDSLFVGIGASGDRYRYIVPCIEILRFFYATSSRLANVCLNGAFVDPHRYLWNTTESYLTKEGTAYVKLRMRMKDADARYLARFAFDPYALFQAREIFLYAAGQNPEGASRIIRALPPMQGRVSLQGVAIPIVSESKERFLITKFVSCDWRPPFNEVTYDRDNDGRSTGNISDDKPESGWSKMSAPVVPPENTDLNLSDDSPSPSIAALELSAEEIEERFPELMKVATVKKEPEETQTTNTRKPSPKLNEPVKGSLATATTSSALVREVLINGLERSPTNEIEIVADVDANVGQTTYLTMLKLLSIIREQKWARVIFLSVSRQTSHVGGIPFCLFPYEIDEQRRAWLYVDKEKKRRRMAFVVLLEHDGCTRYLLEIQHKHDKECSTLVLWNDAEDEMPNSSLEQALYACARAEGTSLSDSPYINFNWNRLKHIQHHPDEVNEDGAERFRDKVFSIEPNR